LGNKPQLNNEVIVMIIELEIPDTLPEGRRSSFKKGIADILIESATKRSGIEHTPDGHDLYRNRGKEVGRVLNEKIQSVYPK
jgi:hypothetical protein